MQITNLALLNDSVEARGEEIVRKIFPETTIVRPAPVFGFEDRLLHKLAGVTNLLMSNHLQQRFWPVHVYTIPRIGFPHILTCYPGH